MRLIVIKNEFNWPGYDLGGSYKPQILGLGDSGGAYES
jgi:hypothetical protein